MRVNPRVPLEQLLPAVCEKCEFDLESTILLRANGSEEPLNLSRSLDDYGLRELYAKDMAGETCFYVTPLLSFGGAGSDDVLVSYRNCVLETVYRILFTH